MDGEYLSAKDAAAFLGVSVSTLYVYVGRKGLRSQAVPGSRERRYFKPDLERVRARGATPSSGVRGEVKRESALTLITERGPFYRGRSAIELAEYASLEEIAALLWDCDLLDAFGPEAPAMPSRFDALNAPIQGRGSIERTIALLHVLEDANPKAYDLSPAGMARTGADVLRWLTAIVLRRREPSVTPLHQAMGEALRTDEVRTDLIRRLLVLAADHGFEPTAYAVRAVASTGVSPWRSVGAGLLVVTGRRSGFGRFDMLRRFIGEVLDASDPRRPVIRRLRDGEKLPGFGSPIYGAVDPRASALLAACERGIGNTRAFERLRIALDLVHDTLGQGPDFALASLFVGLEVGLDQADSPFLVGRSVGWIAHAIEQFGAGESEHREGRYLGLLPKIDGQYR